MAKDLRATRDYMRAKRAGTLNGRTYTQFKADMNTGSTAGGIANIPKAGSDAVQKLIDSAVQQLQTVDRYLNEHGAADYAKNSMPFRAYWQSLDKIGTLLDKSIDRASTALNISNQSVRLRATQNLNALQSAKQLVDSMKKRIDDLGGTRKSSQTIQGISFSLRKSPTRGDEFSGTDENGVRYTIYRRENPAFLGGGYSFGGSVTFPDTYSASVAINSKTGKLSLSRASKKMPKTAAGQRSQQIRNNTNDYYGKTERPKTIEEYVERLKKLARNNPHHPNHK